MGKCELPVDQPLVCSSWSDFHAGLVSSPKAGIAIAGIRDICGCGRSIAGAEAGGAAGVWEITAEDAGTPCDVAGIAGAASREKTTSAMRSRRRIRCFTYLTD